MTEQTLPLPPKGPRRPVQADPAPAPGTAAAPIATWQLSQSGFGDVAIYPSSYGYAGGLVIAGFGDGAWNLAITNLGDGNIALGVTLTDDRGNTSTLYFNSHYPVSNNVLNNGGMTLWIDINAQNNYSSDSISSEQTFGLVNLGGGYIALQATGGAFPGQYLSGMQGGWYPTNWPLGSGSFTAVSSPAALQVNGPQLPILIITKSGYNLDLSGQTLPAINLNYADMRNCILDGADLSAVMWLQGTNFNGAKLRGAVLTGTYLGDATWEGADFTGTDLSTVASAAGADLSGAILVNAVMDKAELFGATLTGATLTGASLAGTILTDATLTGLDLSAVKTVSSCKLGGAKMQRVILSGLDLQGVTLAGGADLTGAHLPGCNLTGVDLTGCNLAGADFTKCIPTGMTLGNNTLQGTDFSGLDLTGVNFPATLGQSTDPDTPTIFANATLPFSAIGLNWSCLDLTGATITGLPTDLAGLNALGARLSGRSFQGYNLDGANFAQATLDNVDFTSASLDKAVFDGALMSGAFFTRAKLNQTSFVGAALGGVSQDEAAEFSFAYVSNCDFTQANLFGVSFAGASLVGGNKLSGSANLQETNFSNAYMANADLTGAVLQGAKFDGAFMVECVLVNVDLSPAQEGSVPSSLTSACLQAANFQGAILSGANLTNAAITDVEGSIPVQYYDQNGDLTPSFPMPYPAGTFPASSSFSAETVCPNGAPYLENVNDGLSLAQMMAATNPPTSWSPANQATAPKNRAPADAEE